MALLLIAPAIRRGDFTIGDLGLFTTYITVLATLPRWAGRVGAYHSQADVSVERMAELLPAPEPFRIVAPVTTRLRSGPGPFAPKSYDAPTDRLERFEVSRL